MTAPRLHKNRGGRPRKDAPRVDDRDLTQVPPPSISSIAYESPTIAALIKVEAYRLGLPLADFSAELVVMGWAVYAGRRG